MIRACPSSCQLPLQHAASDEMKKLVLDTPEPIATDNSIIRMMVDLRRALEKPIDKRRWIMVMDLQRCIGCMGCAVIGAIENKLPPGITCRPVLTQTRGKYPNVSRRFIPLPCMQCENPACTQVCTSNTAWKRKDNIMEIDHDICIGCRSCITACPYSALLFDDSWSYSGFGDAEPQPHEIIVAHKNWLISVGSHDSALDRKARRCHFCSHRIEKGELPACIVNCMGRACFFGDASDPNTLVSELINQPNVLRLNDGLGTKPKVYYLI